MAATGQSATYVNNADPNDKLTIYIESQLSSPLSATETVIFSYTEAKQGTAKNLNGADVGNQQNLEVSGQPAPQFEISNLVFNGIVDSQGVGAFTFTVECQVPITNDGTDNFCDDLNLNDVRFQLIEDTYSGEMSMADAANVFDANAGQAVGSLTGNGFETTLNGPGRMIDYQELIFIMEGKSSYRYFTVNIEALSL
ncbi:MAG: hypothetical protein ACOH5I_13800 [Oligoflexus sp.]